ncbi:phosphatidate cytidylyltransferase [Luedemannella helvata]|uniref:phosphatidate cytidylyltransferase n=1 Tax=Luedemannella helvata TaxID=349315 RepID=UPI003CD0AB71
MHPGGYRPSDGGYGRTGQDTSGGSADLWSDTGGSGSGPSWPGSGAPDASGEVLTGRRAGGPVSGAPASGGPSSGGPSSGGPVSGGPRGGVPRGGARRGAYNDGAADHGAPEYGTADYGTADYAVADDRAAGDRAADARVAGDRAAEPGAAAAPAKGGRAGRNLPAAIGVGVGLGAAVLVSLFIWRPGFLGLVAVAVGVGIWEMVRALRGSGAKAPLFPLLAGGVLMSGLAWWGGADALTFGLIVTILAVFVWRLAEGPDGYERDVTSATLVAVYVPFLAGFAVLLAVPDDGHLRVVTALAAVVLSDTGGYIAGVFFGKHAMAPSVSPKKSWEGFAGSLIATSVGCALLLFFLFDAALLQGALFGLGVSAAAVLGDLAESMLKRDLKIKDMSNLLPGHGGLMDRLDSILFAAPAAYVLFLLLVPAS